jgi:hypothetical protein
MRTYIYRISFTRNFFDSSEDKRVKILVHNCDNEVSGAIRALLHFAKTKHNLSINRFQFLGIKDYIHVFKSKNRYVMRFNGKNNDN